MIFLLFLRYLLGGLVFLIKFHRLGEGVLGQSYTDYLNRWCFFSKYRSLTTLQLYKGEQLPLRNEEKIANFKTEVDKIDIAKLTPVPKLSNVVKNDVVKKTELTN